MKIKAVLGAKFIFIKNLNVLLRERPTLET